MTQRLLLLAILLPAVALAHEEDGGRFTAPPLEPVDADWLHFHGQKVLPEEVYRLMLKLPPDAGPSPETAEEVRLQVMRFLRAAGYEIAHVDTELTDGGVTVHIDEGALEKVVFKGRQTVQTVRFKLALDIPNDVFNRPDLERQVKQLSEQLGLKGLRLVLVPATVMKHMGPQLEDVPEVKGFAIFHELRAYELHIVLPDRDWESGLGADLRLGYIDGLEIQGNYQGRSGIFIDDRWRLVAGVAAGLRRHFITDAFYPHFSRVAFDGQYYFPALPGNLRPAIQAKASLMSRLRGDLNLVDYYASELSAAGLLEWEPSPGIRLYIGGGIFDRRIFWLLPATDQVNYPLAPDVRPSAGTRPFAALRLDFTFDPDNPRWDRRHILWLDFHQQFPGIGAGPFAWTRMFYRWVQPFGWHDLVLRANAYIVWYESVFHDEISLGEFLHGAFGATFVRRAASVNPEFRFSITRDVFKVSIQSEVAVYTDVDRLADRGPLKLAWSFGPGLHLLLEGMFQLDVYVTFGMRPKWVPNGSGGESLTFDGAFATSVNLLKAF